MAPKIGSIPWNKGKKGVMPEPWNKGTKGIMPTPWNKGTHIKSNTGKTHFKKGVIPWNTGLHIQSNNALLEWIKNGGKGWPKGKNRINQSGENHPNWKGGVTPQMKLERNKFTATISKYVMERDNYTCCICGTVGGYLHVDHIQPWSKYIKGRFTMDNCRTLCRPCHYKLTFGKELPINSKWGINISKKDNNIYV